MANQVYEIITNDIIEGLNSGLVPWRKPWRADFGPKNLVSKKPYQGINVFLLGMTRFKSNYWVTFNQAKGLKGYIKKGSQGRRVIFWDIFQKETGKIKSDGKPEKENIPVLKYYTVFNLEQTEGITAPKEENRAEFDPIEKAESLVKGYENGPQINEGKFNRACYNPFSDQVTMPERVAFDQREEFYSTLFHELVHSTGHESRLKRLNQTAFFGSHEYSKEELIAEMGSAFLCAESNILPATIKNSTAYIQSWIKAFQNAPKMIVEASGKAQKSVHLIMRRVEQVQAALAA